MAMDTTFYQLQSQLIVALDTDERKILLEGMARVGTFEQLQAQIIVALDMDERKILLKGMARIGTFEQLQAQLIVALDINERKILLEGMARASIEGGTPMARGLPTRKQYDVFIAHASKDKSFVTPLAYSLKGRGLEIWYDDFILKIGDSLRREIDKGLVQSRYGVVVLSHNFFKNNWPQKELDGLAAREEIGRRIILPIWHNINKKEIISYSPTLADIKAVKSDLGIKVVTDKIIESIFSD
jgi:hypothetical protein